MPIIFGHELKPKTLMIGGGLIAVAVAVVVWLRSRASASAAQQDQPAAAQDQQGAGGMSIPAPTQGIADQYQQQLQNTQLEAGKIANDYQRQLVTQQQTQFSFQQKQEESLAPYLQKEEAAQLGAQTHYYQAVANTRISCPGGQGVAQDPSGQLYCRQKTSGSFLGIPLGDIGRTVQNFIGGVEAAAPSIGYSSAQQAAQYYTGKVFAPKTGQVGGGQQASAKNVRINQPFGTPPFVSTSGGYLPEHGYKESIG